MYRAQSYLWTLVCGVSLPVTMAVLANGNPAAVVFLVCVTSLTATAAAVTKGIADGWSTPKDALCRCPEDVVKRWR